MTSQKKVVQTSLTRDEYEVLVDTLSRKHLTIQEGLHQATLRLIEEENRLNPEDPFFKNRPPAKRSGLRDLSTHHNRYLYGKEIRFKVKRR